MSAAEVAKMRERADALRKSGDRAWANGKKESSDGYHSEAAHLEKEATKMERLEASSGLKPAYQQRNCTMCQEPVRGGAKPHYLLPGTLVISLHGTSKSDVLEETRRYCASCAPVVGDALMELGFTIEKRQMLPPGEYKVSARAAPTTGADCNCPRGEQRPVAIIYHMLSCPYLTYDDVRPTAQLAPGNIGPVFSSPCPRCGYSDCHCEDDQ